MSVIITFIISRCFAQHQNYCDMELNTEATNKITKQIHKQTQVNKTYCQKPYKYQNTFQKINHALHERKHLLCDYMIPSNKLHDKHWIIFTRYLLMMQNIVCISFIYHTKSIKTMKMPSCQNSIKFIHQEVSCIFVWFASTSKFAVWFVIAKERKAQKTYSHVSKCSVSPKIFL